MGNLAHGFLDGFSGRLGNTIGYNWRGRMCVRSMPSHYNDARTSQQLQQRALFKSVVGFASKARQVLKKGLRAASIDAQMTESNYFMRINKRCFSIDATSEQEPPLPYADARPAAASGATPAFIGALSVDYENLLLADGPVAPVAFDTPQLLDDTTLSIGFEKNPMRRVAKPEDLVYLAAYCPELGDFDLSTPVYRRSNCLTMNFNSHWAGRKIHLWGFVVDNADRASQSQYLGYLILDYTSFVTPENDSHNNHNEIDTKKQVSTSIVKYQTETTKTDSLRFKINNSPPLYIQTNEKRASE